ncbi:MAG: 1-acyl-sn-glycerol-3-phosphate acyltransferase [Nannocystis sp.]|nr:lysophospholipid acyltransferase family protein [Nannocystis sp.]MBA3548383.1 1-acyl-sn-glycerol-3-phosphate acyltransferase [Nannocystis sp.]
MSAKPGSPLALALAIWTWFELCVLSLACFFLQLVLAPLTWPFDRNRVITGSLYRRTAVIVSRLTPLWDFKVVGSLPARMGRTVVVSNHCSQADPFLISGVPWEMKWLGKASLFRVPVMGWSMWLAGDIPVVRGEKASARSAMARCARYLERGMPVMIFPEGTRSLTDEIGPFKDGAFQLAITTGADILPLAVHGTASALPVHDWRFARARARVAIGDPISTAGMSLEDIPHLKQIVREEIEALRAKLRPLTTM